MSKNKYVIWLDGGRKKYFSMISFSEQEKERGEKKTRIKKEAVYVEIIKCNLFV